MSKFSGLAHKAVSTNVNFITEGREKIKMSDLIKTYPNGVTVDGFALIADKKKNDGSLYPVCTFVEDPTKFFYGGYTLQKITQEWLRAYNNDAQVCNIELKESGGVHMKFTLKTTKQGRTVYDAEIE